MTNWLEVFRLAEQNRLLPDFLDNHDSGDYGGVGGLVSMSVMNHQSITKKRLDTPITRYCVEVLNATISDTTTTTQGASPTASPYADYRSTNPLWYMWQLSPFRPLIKYGEQIPGAEYWSWCELYTDRNLGQLPFDHVECCDSNSSSPTFQSCHACCSNASAAASRRHVGMAPFGLPMYTFPPSLGFYPNQVHPIGRWFSHPAGSRCPLGAAVGDGGCTWQRAPLSHSVYMGELIGARGMNRSAVGFNASGFGEVQPPAQTRFNVDVFREVWARKGLLPCGK